MFNFESPLRSFHPIGNKYMWSMSIFLVVFTIFDVFCFAEAKSETWTAEETIQNFRKGLYGPSFPNAGNFGFNSPEHEIHIKEIYSKLRYSYSFESKSADALLWKACMNDRMTKMNVRLFAAHYLLDQDEDARNFVLKAIAVGNKDDRENAAEAVCLHVNQNPESKWGIDVLIRLVENSGPEVCRLYQKNKFGGSPTERKYLQWRTSIEYICQTLGKVKATPAVPALLGLLNRDVSEILEQDPDISSNCIEYGKNAAAIALWEIGDPLATPYLLKMLKETSRPDPSIVYTIGECNRKEAIPILINHLLSDQTRMRYGKVTIVRALAKIDDPRVVPALEKYLTMIPQEDQGQTRRLLVQLNSTEPVGDYLKILENDNYKSEHDSVIYELSKYNDPRVFETLKNITQTSDSMRVRSSAIRGLAKLRTRSSLLFLTSLLDYPFPSSLKDGDGKSPLNTAQILHKRVVGSLKSSTGQDFGDDQQKWEAWIWANLQ